MNIQEILPPGKHPVDQFKHDLDPIGWHLERIQTCLMWIDEHRASFEKLRSTNPSDAEAELAYLKHSTYDAILHVHRLTELLIAGYKLGSDKRLPKGLLSEPWLRCVEILLKEGA
jgi:hypothetical protein